MYWSPSHTIIDFANNDNKIRNIVLLKYVSKNSCIHERIFRSLCKFLPVLHVEDLLKMKPFRINMAVSAYLEDFIFMNKEKSY